MAEKKRDIGKEILEGLREIKRVEHGRVTNPFSITSLREPTLKQEIRKEA